MNDKQKAIQTFERLRNIAEARALSRISLERELTNAEFMRFKELGIILGLRDGSDGLQEM